MRLKTSPPLASGEAKAAGVCWRVGLKFACTSGKYFPCWAYIFSLATRNAASADCRVGLASIAFLVKELSARDRNSTHHSAGISRPSRKRCDSPNPTPDDAVRDGKDSFV